MRKRPTGSSQVEARAKDKIKNANIDLIKVSGECKIQNGDVRCLTKQIGLKVVKLFCRTGLRS
jgi:hypothetical protein